MEPSNEIQKRSIREWVLRYLIFCFGMSINAFGICFITKANMGTSPISSIPYTLSIGLGPTMGQFTLYTSLVMFLIEMLLLRKRFPKQYFLQIPVSFLFSYLIDLSMQILEKMSPSSYGMQVLYLVGGCAILSVGVCAEVVADVVMLPGEAFVNSVALAFHANFGKTKVAVDCTLSAIALLLGLILYHKPAGVREGTVLAALLIGQMVRLLKRLIAPVEQKMFSKV